MANRQSAHTPDRSREKEAISVEIEQQILDYFRSIDEAIDTLSLHLEEQLVQLPSWVHTTRSITIGITDDGEGIALRVDPKNTLTGDVTKLVPIKSIEGVDKLVSPMSYRGGALNRLPEDYFMLVGDMIVTPTANPLLPPAVENRFLVGWGRRRAFQDLFSIEQAKEDAIDIWNKRRIDEASRTSYVSQVKNIIYSLQAIIKRKAFLERRIHRFLYRYKDLLLPAHKRCLYDHILRRGTESLKADFILEREEGFPPILIELESPVHPVFTKAMDLTAPANHARQQISEWVSFIDSDPAINAPAELTFLTGPKERLVIIGRGLEHRTRLIDTKFDGTIIWTYDIFIEEARRRLNDQYTSQCHIVGLETKRPF